jgi:iron complex outermembrane receptor protein
LIPVRFTNNMEGYTRGMEVIVGWQIHQDLFVALDYTYLEMSLDGPEADKERTEGTSPRHQLGTRGYWDIREDWMLGASVKYVDELPAQNVDSYVRLDVNIIKRFGDSLKFNLVGQNLLKSSQREFGAPDGINTGEIERSIFAKLTWQF